MFWASGFTSRVALGFLWIISLFSVWGSCAYSATDFTDSSFSQGSLLRSIADPMKGGFEVTPHSLGKVHGSRTCHALLVAVFGMMFLSRLRPTPQTKNCRRISCMSIAKENE